MALASSPSREVPVDVLPPLPPDARDTGTPVVREKTPPASGWNSFYHPASGVVILGIDLLVFGPEMLSGFLDTPVMCVLAFMATLPLVFLIQWKWSRNTISSAFGKAFLGAFLAGLPFSITGTMFGAAVLAMSGLPRNPWDAFKRITAPDSNLKKNPSS